MANGDDITGAAPEIPSGPPGGAPGGAPSGGPMGAGAPPQPMGGGPILAALSRRSQGPQVSAPGMGNMAQGLMQLKSAVDMLQSALPNLGSGSQQYKDCLKALSSLSKHLPQGAPTAGAQQTQIQDLLRNTIRNAIMQRLVAQGRGPGAGGAGGQPGGMPQAPTPSTPMPGA